MCTEARYFYYSRDILNVVIFANLSFLSVQYLDKIANTACVFK